MINKIPVNDADEMNELIIRTGESEFLANLDLEESIYLMVAMNEFAASIKGVIFHNAVRQGEKI